MVISVRGRSRKTKSNEMSSRGLSSSLSVRPIQKDPLFIYYLRKGLSTLRCSVWEKVEEEYKGNDRSSKKG